MEKWNIKNGTRASSLTFSFIHFYESRRVLFYILFWVFLFLMYQVEILFLNPSFGFGLSFMFTLREIVQSLIAFYFISYFVIPKLLFNKRIVSGTLCLVIPFVLAPSINYVVFYAGSKIFSQNAMFNRFLTASMFLQKPSHLFSFQNINMSFMPVLLRTMPAFVAKLLLSVIGYFQKASLLQQKEHQLERDNLQLEINFLKSQMNPHFLFNTLNNIYAYVALNDKKALTLIADLSDMLQYTLYGTKDSVVTLERELCFLKNYIDLEQVRYNESNCKIEYNIDYNGVKGFTIAPLLLFPFVENAFKHGIARNKKNGWMTMMAKMENDSFIFKVENNKKPAKSRNESTAIYKEEIGGIGISNTQRRLSILYAEKHELLISDEQEKYAICLKINCKKDEPEFNMYNH